MTTRAQRGQGSTEMIILVALLAIACIAVVTLFGDNLRSLFGASSDSVAGAGDVANPGRQSSSASTERNMNNFAYGEAYNPDNPPSGGGGAPPAGGQ